MSTPSTSTPMSRDDSTASSTDGTTGDRGAALERALEEVIAPRADEVDRDGAFPGASLDALAAAGVLGLVSAPEVGGGGGGLAEAVQALERVASACGSTAMVLLMHYAATAVLEEHGDREVRSEIARGRHLSTLAFSEAGSRSHFWIPMSSAVPDGDGVRLDARKSWVTSAEHADSYVWSSRPADADGPMTLWLVPADATGVSVAGEFDGLGLRGNDSRPVTGEAVRIPETARLGGDGAGLDVALSTVLPWFLTGNAACSLGLMEAVVSETTAHLTRTRLEHLDSSLAEQPVPRAGLARMRIRTDLVRALIEDTLRALDEDRRDAQLKVLEVKAAADDAAIEVTEQAMRLCGGAAFRRDVGVERRFRDARAARVMAPTTDALQDFVGRALCDLPLVEVG